MEDKTIFANFEVIAYKDGRRVINTYALAVYNGITNYLYDRYKAAGYTDISVRMI